MYHYTLCGLPNVYLENGYIERETKQGKAVAIQDIKGLHKAIGLHLTRQKNSLNGAEMRFLRSEMLMSQQSLADILGVSESTYRKMEKIKEPKNNRIPPCDRLLRGLYKEFIKKDSKLRWLVEEINKLDSLIANESQEPLKFRETKQGWIEALSA